MHICFSPITISILGIVKSGREIYIISVGFGERVLVVDVLTLVCFSKRVSSNVPN